jgi:hypothetical protein
MQSSRDTERNCLPKWHLATEFDNEMQQNMALAASVFLSNVDNELQISELIEALSFSEPVCAFPRFLGLAGINFLPQAIPFARARMT